MQLELNTIFESDSNSLNGIQIIIVNSIQDKFFSFEFNSVNDLIEISIELNS
jgi:hypothetical protein